jgi:hypothetical protein
VLRPQVMSIYSLEHALYFFPHSSTKPSGPLGVERGAQIRRQGKTWAGQNGETRRAWSANSVWFAHMYLYFKVLVQFYSRSGFDHFESASVW